MRDPLLFFSGRDWLCFSAVPMLSLHSWPCPVCKISLFVKLGPIRATIQPSALLTDEQCEELKGGTYPHNGKHRATQR
ncbi:uncharacterized [Tachysurus ichikawai]